MILRPFFLFVCIFLFCSLVLNIFLFKKAQDTFKPNQAKYNEVFSGFEVDPIHGAPPGPLFRHSFVFLVKTPQGQYELSAVSRNRCLGIYGGVILDQESTKQWDAYVGHAILIQDYAVNDQGVIKLIKIEPDVFTQARLPLLKEAYSLDASVIGV